MPCIKNWRTELQYKRLQNGAAAVLKNSKRWESTFQPPFILHTSLLTNELQLDYSHQIVKISNPMQPRWKLFRKCLLEVRKDWREGEARLLYINLACLFVCLSVCLYPINVKTAEPIGPKFFVAHHVTTGRQE